MQTILYGCELNRQMQTIQANIKQTFSMEKPEKQASQKHTTLLEKRQQLI